MPSAENFFFDLFQTNKTENRPAGSLNFLGLTFEGLHDLITRAWDINHDGYNPEEWKGVNIEEVMTFFETSAKMFPIRSEERKVFQMAQKYLLSFIYPLIPLRCDDQHCEYLTKVFFGLKKYDSVFSYNWDTIADLTLQKIKAIQLKNYAGLLRDEDVEIENYKDKGLFLKMHGSFNWMMCQNKKCSNFKKVIPPFQKNRYILTKLRANWKCPNCDSNKVEPFIVPPVSDKMIHKNTLLRNQWLIAREQLLNTNELVFIGYSFPPTDFYTEWLFRQIYFIAERPELKVTVVNPEYGKRNSSVTKRYKSIFRNVEIEGYKTLKDYVDKKI